MNPLPPGGDPRSLPASFKALLRPRFIMMTPKDKQVVEALSVLRNIQEVWRGPGVLVTSYWIRSPYDFKTINRVMKNQHVSWLNGQGPVPEGNAELIWSNTGGYAQPKP